MTTTSKQILYLSYDGLTDPLGQSQILPYLIGLSKKGFRFVIVSFEKEERFLSEANKIKTLCHQHQIVWIPKKYHKRPPVVSTIFDLLVLWRAVKDIMKEESISIIHCRSYLTSIIGLSAKKRWNSKFIFDMRGFWADERVEGGLWNLKNPAFKMIFGYFKKKEKEFLREADHVISLTQNAKLEIESWSIKTAPITVLPTCVDLEVFDPKNINEADQKELRTQLGIDPMHYVLLYLGSWGTWYMTDKMLRFFTNLKKNKPNAKFLIVSQDKINLDGYQFKEDVILTSSPRQLVPLYISLADASLFFIKPSFSKKASAATKMAEIMAMNVPVITNSGWGDVDFFSSQGEANLTLVDLDDMENFSMDFTKFRTREFCSTMFSLEMGISRYEHVYKTLTNLS